jgi:hypothetical protein
LVAVIGGVKKIFVGTCRLLRRFFAIHAGTVRASVAQRNPHLAAVQFFASAAANGRTRMIIFSAMLTNHGITSYMKYALLYHSAGRKTRYYTKT